MIVCVCKVVSDRAVKAAIASGPVGACQLVDADQIITPPDGSSPAGGLNGVEPTAYATAH